MSNEYFDIEKQAYENIEIPEDLDFLIRKTLKEGKRKNNHKSINKWSTAIAGVVLTFVLLVNLFPKVAYAASLIPGFDKLVKLVTFDRGFDNAVKEGLTKTINFKETKNGITLKVDGLAGDWKMLWVNYSVDDGKGNEKLKNGAQKYYVEVNVNLPEELKEIGYSSGHGGLNENGESYAEIAFPQFIQNFTLVFNVLENNSEYYQIGSEVPKQKIIATFELPVTLEPEIFNSPLNEITIDNNLIQTPVGDVLIDNIKSSKTRIQMALSLQSDIYDYMGFENPRLVDDKGNEYKPNGFYKSEDIKGNKFIEFAGAINEDIKTLKFECDGLYYARKDNRKIVLNLKEKVVEPNYYGFYYVQNSNEEGIDPDIVIIRSKGLKSASFYGSEYENILKDEGMNFFGSEEEGFTTQCYFKVLDKNVEKVTLNLAWVRKDMTGPISGKLIK